VAWIGLHLFGSYCHIDEIDIAAPIGLAGLERDGQPWAAGGRLVCVRCFRG
jgi:hypothetical protein